MINSYSSFHFEKLDVDIPDLYADAQNITVEKDKDYIELKFKINSYYNEKLFFILFDNKGNDWSVINILDNCTKENKELICSLKKEFLLQIMTSNSNSLQLVYIDNNYQSNIFSLFHIIYINYYILNLLKQKRFYYTINSLILKKKMYL